MAITDRPAGWTVQQEIKMLRAQMLIHSCLYYILDESILTDHQWQDRADRLTQLQNAHPDQNKLGFYDDDFANWDGSSGYHLPLTDPWVVNKALQIYRIHEKNGSNPATTNSKS